MKLFKDYNFAFFHINKTAGTSAKKFLTEVLGSDSYRVGLLLNNKNRPRVHETLTYKIERLQQMGIDYTELKILANIRNPYERWVSLYTSLERNFFENPKISDFAVLARYLPFDCWFEEYILHSIQPQHWSQTRYLFIESPLVFRPHIPSNVYIIKSEDVDEELPKFMEKELGIKTDLQVPHNNVSNDFREKDTMDYYPDHLRKLIYQEEKYIIDNYYPEFKY